ncbi:MAG: helix-turn-helix domain-containing protein [Candidatus Marinimicrobia bacterium]|nr:helix-turn-helix domain-containing protein [Candidatus Neomarinimicrobiota bacterium]
MYSMESHFTEPQLFRDGLGQTYRVLPTQLALDKVGFRPDIAKAWCEMVSEQDDALGSYIPEIEVALFDDPKNEGIRDALNLCFIQSDDILELVTEKMLWNEGYKLSENSLALMARVKEALSLFPELELCPNTQPDENELINPGQAARILMISEQRLRKLASQGMIHSVKSQGETGHYRFKREWLREYLESMS